MARITITDLAKRLGVSVCTINKALTGKPRVGAETRDRILKAARRLGYQPNRLAQALARNAIRIGVVYPKSWPFYHGPLVTGVREGIATLADHSVDAAIRQIGTSRQSDETLASIRSLLRGGLDGLIVCQAAGVDYRPAWELLAERRIPLALLGVDMPAAPRLVVVRQDARRCGRMAAALLAPLVGRRPVALFVGDVRILDHSDKVEGFAAESARAGLSFAGVYEHHDDPARGYPTLRRALAEHPDLGGIYIATDNTEGICRCIRERGLAGKLKAVATSVAPEVRAALEDGVVQFTLFQRMEEQGRLVVEALYRYLAEKLIPPKEILLPPQIVIRANVDAVIEQSMPGATATTERFAEPLK
jgi:LacI family transcriptional regulator